MKEQILDFVAVAVVDDNMAYASDYFMNGLYKLNFSDGAAEFLGLFPKEEINKGHLHVWALYYAGKVWFVPEAGKYLSIYDIQNNSFESVRIPVIEQKNINYKCRCKFVHAYIYNNFLWLIPSLYSGIVRVSLEDYSLYVYDEWIPEEGFYFRKTYIYNNNVLYIADRDTNNILKFDFDTMEGVICKVGRGGYMSAFRKNDNIYFAPTRAGTLVKWNYMKNEVTEYNLCPEDFVGGEVYYSKIYQFDDRFYMVPNTANMILEWNPESERLHKCDWFQMEQGAYNWYLFETEEYMFFRYKTKSIIYRFKISKESNERSEYGFVCTDGSKTRIICNTAKEKDIYLNETALFGLEEFIDGLL